MGLLSSWLVAGLLASDAARRSPAQRALSALCLLAALLGVEDGSFLPLGLFATVANAAGVFFVLFLNFERSEDRLRVALSQVNTLKGLLPICASCKKVKDDQGHWERIETYVSDRSDVEFSHGFCPSCCERLYSEGQDEG